MNALGCYIINVSDRIDYDDFLLMVECILYGLSMFKITMPFNVGLIRACVRYSISLQNSLVIDPNSILGINQHTQHCIMFYSFMYRKVDKFIFNFRIERQDIRFAKNIQIIVAVFSHIRVFSEFIVIRLYGIALLR